MINRKQGQNKDILNWKPSNKKNIEPHQNCTVSYYKKSLIMIVVPDSITVSFHKQAMDLNSLNYHSSITSESANQKHV